MRVYKNNKLLTSYEMSADSYPCTVIVDDFDSAKGNEVAVGWLSVAAGYTAGATILKVSN